MAKLRPVGIAAPTQVPSITKPSGARVSSAPKTAPATRAVARPTMGAIVGRTVSAARQRKVIQPVMGGRARNKAY